jgi:zinc finger protein
MATTCEKCGLRENEVKGGSGIEPKGRKIILNITDPTDLSRDVLKAEMAAVRIPELDFETVEGTLGGKFTTIEGLLTDIKNQVGFPGAVEPLN